ncbi:MAG: type II/IV secretion system protein, partial [Planctomycetota bacterium]|nr:type II/IV secretion system protein [Planctomycetota bacterium]
MAADWVQKLVKDGVISKDQFAEARDLSSRLGIKVEDALQKLGYVNPSDIGQAQAKQFGYDFIDLSSMQIPASVVQLVPESVARENIVLPISLDDANVLTVAMHDPMKFEVLDKLRFIINREIKVVVAQKEEILQAV